MWKFLLPIFKSARRTNYSLEALNLLSQQLTLSPREVQQLVWSRFVNTHGRSGCNKPCDLEMEHLNISCKTAVAALGANTTKKAIVTVGKCIGPIVAALHQFDIETAVPDTHGAHSSALFQKDIRLVVRQLQDSHVFATIRGRFHPSFKTIIMQQCVYENKNNSNHRVDEEQYNEKVQINTVCYNYIINLF